LYYLKAKTDNSQNRGS